MTGILTTITLLSIKLLIWLQNGHASVLWTDEELRTFEQSTGSNRKNKMVHSLLYLSISENAFVFLAVWDCIRGLLWGKCILRKIPALGSSERKNIKSTFF